MASLLTAIADAIRRAIAALKAIIIKFLTWIGIANWFRARENLKNSDKDNIAFTLQEKLKNGQFKTVKGIFNKNTNELVDGEKSISDQIDGDVAKIHRNDELVIYE
jgi:hypothetical protein